ncbi:Disintegrin and metalloproteinase domain-containing protein 10, partial [Stegodyphus mimosarum]
MTIKQWVTSCWWGVLLSVVGFAIFMGIFIKCCAVHTPSSNPRKAPALRIQDTLRHPADTLRRKRHRPQGPPSGPPPPYPGPRPSAPPAPGPAIAGPSHGYGEGRGHYNRRDKTQLPPPTRNKNRIDDHAYVYSKGTAIEMRGKAYA